MCDLFLLIFAIGLDGISFCLIKGTNNVEQNILVLVERVLLPQDFEIALWSSIYIYELQYLYLYKQPLKSWFQLFMW